MLKHKSNSVPGTESSKLRRVEVNRKNKTKERKQEKVKFGFIDILPQDCLEIVVSSLDTQTCLSLLRVNKEIYEKLRGSVTFWKHVCKNEHFDEFNALKKDDDEDEEISNTTDEEDNKIINKTPRLTYSGHTFHDTSFSDDTTYWNRVFLRGIQMRRNIRLGRFELWRLFMTDADSLPVMKMKSDTTFRELRSQHRKCPFNDERRRVRTQRYWNENYLVVIQQTVSREVTELFVWRWSECQKPEFLYNYNLRPLYPSGLFPTSFFLWKQYFVLMPDTGYRDNEYQVSMIRVHDLSNNFSLVGQYNLPESGNLRRHLPVGDGTESPHLHNIGDYAVALCRTPQFRLFVFSLPDCRLVRSVVIPSDISNRFLEMDSLDQRFLLKDNRMMFLFHDPNFFDHLFATVDGNEWDNMYGQLLTIDLNKFLKKENEDIEIRVDSEFDCNDDYIEKISLISSSRMVCAHTSGKIVIRKLSSSLLSPSRVKSADILTLPCPEPLLEDNQMDEEIDLDGPNLCTSLSGDIVVILRHFKSGRKIHAYSDTGMLLYMLEIDCPRFQLEPRSGYLSLDMDGQFLCAADQNKIVIWNNRTGQYVNTINIPAHYNYRDDTAETADQFCWKGHSDFAFTEDGILIIHSQRNFPIAADVLLFW